MNKPNQIRGAQLYSLLVVRVLIGWYFLYQGVIKLLNPNFSVVMLAGLWYLRMSVFKLSIE